MGLGLGLGSGLESGLGLGLGLGLAGQLPPQAGRELILGEVERQLVAERPVELRLERVQQEVDLVRGGARGRGRAWVRVRVGVRG